MHTPRTALVVSACCLAAAAGQCRAQELFEFRLEEIGNPANTLSRGGSTLPDLVSDLANQEGLFSSFDGVAFSSTVDYAGFANAIGVSFDPTGPTDVIRITNLAGTDISPSNPLVFDAANGDLGDQLEDFFVKDNPDIISDFLSEVAARSVLAVTDGNPLASTARSADYKFKRFGLHQDWTPTTWELSLMRANRRDVTPAAPPEGSVVEGEEGDAPLGDLPSVSINEHRMLRSRIAFSGGTVEADGFDGSSFELHSSTELAFTDRFGVVLGIPLSYHEFDGADVFNLGVHLDVPITLIRPESADQRGFIWTVTPGASLDGVGSFDFAGGGLLYSAAIGNRVTYAMQHWQFTLAQQFSWHESEKIEYDDYEFDPGVSQQILKLGGKVTGYLNDNIFLFGGATWTDFLDDAAVDNYTSPTAGLGARFANGATISVSWEGDYGDDFERQTAGISITLPY
ncbi:MAG: hypothetical protein AAGG07_07930 [Planctomycetota bacterium]